MMLVVDGVNTNAAVVVEGGSLKYTNTLTFVSVWINSIWAKSFLGK